MVEVDQPFLSDDPAWTCGAIGVWRAHVPLFGLVVACESHARPEFLKPLGAWCLSRVTADALHRTCEFDRPMSVAPPAPEFRMVIAEALTRCDCGATALVCGRCAVRPLARARFRERDAFPLRTARRA